MQVQKKIAGISALCSVLLLMVIVLCKCYDNVFDTLKGIPFFGWFIAYNFPPPDYYVPRAKFPLSEYECSTNIVFRYRGRYDVQISNIHTNIPIMSNIILAARLTNDAGEEVWSASRGRPDFFAYYDDTGGGYRLFFFALEVPTDVPAHKKLKLAISLSGGIKEFMEMYPHAEIAVRKVFDK